MDLGVGLAEPEAKTVCYVEWEREAARTLVAGMRAGYLHPAPVWDNVLTFVGARWQGVVDTIIAGYPCQPFSAAGKRDGENDERHLWPDIARIIQEVRPRYVFLENVAGHVSLGLDTVLGDLRRMGFKVAAGLFSAAETGATHKRERLFILAYSESGGCGERGQEGHTRRIGHSDSSDAGLADPGSGQLSQPRRGSEGRNGSGSAGPQRGLGDAGGAGLEGREQPEAHRDGDGPGAHGPTAEPGRAWLPTAPPRPNDYDGWAEVMRVAPHLAPAISIRDVKRICDRAAEMVAERIMEEEAAEPVLRGMVDGMAQRPRALKLYGNGVHPMAAAYAFRTLGYALGLRPVDLAGTG